VAQETLGHLGSGRVVGAEEEDPLFVHQDAWLRSRRVSRSAVTLTLGRGRLHYINNG
jgi:hypothetical protein